MTETDTTESVDVDLDATVPCESLTGCGETYTNGAAVVRAALEEARKR